MRFEILLAPEAIEDLRRFRAHVRSELKDGIEKHLRHEPRKESQSRIKRLKGLIRPQYRLRVGDIRVFYDVTASRVEVLAIISKEGSRKWLDETAKQD